ncbi:MAG: TVP38/TMEM64 family protein [Peptococcaceae bacterium]|nr:TVP38/TMEM64 family protein [Peptococcaceae bacterium]
MTRDDGYESSRLLRALTIAGLVLTGLLCVYGVASGLFFDKEKLARFLLGAGYWGPLVFILIQILQVIVPVIPGGVGNAVGVLLFGPWLGFLYNYTGILAGSCINFLLIRRYGHKLARALVSAKTYDKYIGWLDQSDKFPRLFTAAIILPGLPDDFLCMLAGLSRMTFRQFFLVLAFGKPISIFLYSLAALTAGGWFGRLLAGF